MKHVQTEDGDVLSALRTLYPQSSTTTLRKMLTQGRVVVNGEVVHRAKHSLQSGDSVEVLQRQQAEERTPPPQDTPDVDLDVLYEDDALLIVNKPHQLLSVATDRLEQDTLHSRCVDYLRWTDKKAWCFIVHRLDKATSGIMVMAKTKQAKLDLQQQFLERSVHRSYMALVEGTPAPLSGTVRTWLLEDKHLNIKAVNKNHPQGKEAISHYHVVERGHETCLVEVSIETGRRHQIRMAMQHLNVPVVGDERHGATTDPHQRVMLHAHALEFLHPSNDDPVRFEAPTPRKFRSV
ncbi:MAG: RluA family pseudouridine synthase [Candidatus Poseidoniales archaeon]|jgi:23S rRNA pseudouridine1911/1915/1917 synthase